MILWSNKVFLYEIMEYIDNDARMYLSVGHLKGYTAVEYLRCIKTFHIFYFNVCIFSCNSFRNLQV